MLWVFLCVETISVAIVVVGLLTTIVEHMSSIASFHQIWCPLVLDVSVIQ